MIRAVRRRLLRALAMAVSSASQAVRFTGEGLGVTLAGGTAPALVDGHPEHLASGHPVLGLDGAVEGGTRRRRARQALGVVRSGALTRPDGRGERTV